MEFANHAMIWRGSPVPVRCLMNSAERELEAAALALPRSERARLAERLLASLDEESEIEEAWRVEVERRLARYRSGELQSIPAGSVHEEAARRLKR